MNQETEKKIDETLQRIDADMSEQRGNGQAETKAETKVVSVEDRLFSENLHLRVMKLALETQLLETQLHAKMQERQDLDQRIRAQQKALEERYGIDLSTHMIRDSDGAVVPRDIRQLMRPR